MASFYWNIGWSRKSGIEDLNSSRWGTGIPLLVTACCDNSEFSRVVTLKSLSEIFSM